MVDEANVAWQPKLKGYPHFDSPVTKERAVAIATNPETVSHHKFLPFLSYCSFTKKFGAKKPKERLIRYGARKDAYIYSYYRKLLMDRYNPLLEQLGLSECVIAYRHLTYMDQGMERGKCNINYAKEAFEEIAKRGDCVAITLDISGFFENLAHNLIKEKWCRVLGKQRLPADHYRVYRNITNYKVVDLDECYQRLGLLEFEAVRGKRRKKYKFSRKDQPRQLCKMDEFRAKIVGNDPAYESIIRGNPYIDPQAEWVRAGNAIEDFEPEFRGIPQGSPISDVIANMYMLDFDCKIKALADSVGGYYRRYSDDILIIMPTGAADIHTIIGQIRSALDAEGGYLKIKKSKTIVTRFTRNENKTSYESFDEEGNSKGNAFEYLGFSFDGQRVLLKSQTLTRYYKKMIRGVKAAVSDAVEKAKANGKKDPRPYIDMSGIFHRYSNPHRGWLGRDKKKARNFMSYVKRSKNVIGDEGIQRQLRRHRRTIRKTLDKEIAAAMRDSTIL